MEGSRVKVITIFTAPGAAPPAVTCSCSSAELAPLDLETLGLILELMDIYKLIGNIQIINNVLNY